jgi:hypothetical protein
MQTNTSSGEQTVATALGGVIVRGEQNRMADTATPGTAGAQAALETFYFAFNTRSAALYQEIWADDPFVQLSSPVAGLVRGKAGIAKLAARMLSAPVQMQTVVEDIIAYAAADLVVFTGREHGAYTSGSEQEVVADRAEVRSICVFRFIPQQGGWRLVYHLVSMDDADELARLQRAVRSQ